MVRAKVLVKESVFYDEPRSSPVEEAAAMYNTHELAMLGNVYHVSRGH